MSDEKPIETAVPVVCPNCKREGRSDLSRHFVFYEERLLLRCRVCNHVWAVTPNIQCRLAKTNQANYPSHPFTTSGRPVKDHPAFKRPAS